jgi:hypothetical protein
MANKKRKYFSGGWVCEQQVIGSVVLIDMRRGSERKTEVYVIDANGLEVFQGYAS